MKQQCPEWPAGVRIRRSGMGELMKNFDVRPVFGVREVITDISNKPTAKVVTGIP